MFTHEKQHVVIHSLHARVNGVHVILMNNHLWTCICCFVTNLHVFAIQQFKNLYLNSNFTSYVGHFPFRLIIVSAWKNLIAQTFWNIQLNSHSLNIFFWQEKSLLESEINNQNQIIYNNDRSRNFWNSLWKMEWALTFVHNVKHLQTMSHLEACP
jgi:hypothetical protein